MLFSKKKKMGSEDVQPTSTPKTIDQIVEDYYSKYVNNKMIENYDLDLDQQDKERLMSMINSEISHQFTWGISAEEAAELIYQEYGHLNLIKRSELAEKKWLIDIDDFESLLLEILDSSYGINIYKVGATQFKLIYSYWIKFYQQRSGEEQKEMTEEAFKFSDAVVNLPWSEAVLLWEEEIKKCAEQCAALIK